MTGRNKNSLVELRKHLRTKTQKELIDEIVGLYKSFDNVKEHYQASFFNDDDGVLNKYKTVILQEFYPKSPRQDPPARLSVAKKAIRDYKKISCSDKGLADIMVYYVEIGVQFINDYGVIDTDDAFYTSMMGMYQQALDFIYKQGLIDPFRGRLKAIISDTDNMRWGFHEELVDLYINYIDEE
jgi:Family of unknown function (DUF6155)